MFVNPKTGLVACKFLGVPNPEAPEPDSARMGHAAAGLIVGEIRGFDPATAKTMVDKGYAELIPEAIVKAALGLTKPGKADAPAAGA